jgi:protein Tex
MTTSKGPNTDIEENVTAKKNGTEFDPVPALAAELSLSLNSVRATVNLLTEGGTVPFIARYRKEATGGLDEVQIRTIDERRGYLLEMEERRQTILSEIDKQGKLTDLLRKQVTACTTKAELEDLYLPFKPKRRTRAMIAREKGLEPLGDKLWSQALQGDPDSEAQAFVNSEKGVADTAAALAGARDICAERLAEDASVRKVVRESFAKEGTLRVLKEKEHEGKATKFDTYADYEESLASIPSHRFLAIRRGEADGVLRASLELDTEKMVQTLTRMSPYRPSSPWAEHLLKAVQDAYKRLISPSVQSDLRIDLKLNADRAAVDVFAQNLRELLLAAPLGTHTVIGIDPGQRTGCKVVVVDQTGKLLDHSLIHLVQGASAEAKAKQIMIALFQKFNPIAIAIGNGTHGRETETFVRDLIRDEGWKDCFSVLVSEAGASVYSASDVAREEFPDLDLTVRGAISIARRLQDPLAELVKIDPKSIGVGQYQHDIHQPLMTKKLNEVVESCVNQVGVELNTASVPLLARVAGVGPTLAKKIVTYRNEKGAFPSRKALLSVPGVGPRTYQQAAGFLRVRGGEHPLDASAVHPERYDFVEQIAKDLNVPVTTMIGNDSLLAGIRREKYLNEEVGEFTFNDIMAELRKPGRDPRASFEAPTFRDDVRTMNDLTVGMVLEGVVTNVTAFGAFVDIGVHQDGLVHISKLSDRFVKDPSEVVKVGEKIQVTVMEIDLERKRISLSARKGERPETQGTSSGQKPSGGKSGQNRQSSPSRPTNKTSNKSAQEVKFSNNPFAQHFKK